MFGQFLPVHKWHLAVYAYAAVGRSGWFSQYKVYTIGRASIKRVRRPDLIVEGHAARHPCWASRIVS